MRYTCQPSCPGLKVPKGQRADRRLSTGVRPGSEISDRLVEDRIDRSSHGGDRRPPARCRRAPSRRERRARAGGPRHESRARPKALDGAGSADRSAWLFLGGDQALLPEDTDVCLQRERAIRQIQGFAMRDVQIVWYESMAYVLAGATANAKAANENTLIIEFCSIVCAPTLHNISLKFSDDLLGVLLGYRSRHR